MEHLLKFNVVDRQDECLNGVKATIRWHHKFPTLFEPVITFGIEGEMVRTRSWSERINGGVKLLVQRFFFKINLIIQVYLAEHDLYRPRLCTKKVAVGVYKTILRFPPNICDIVKTVSGRWLLSICYAAFCDKD
jgi:hypothetical protein